MILPEPTWLLPQTIDPPAELLTAVGGHPLVSQTLALRGITNTTAALAFLDPDLYQPANPDDLPGLTVGCERLWKAIQSGETIGVWGDFDVDGQTSTALLVGILQDLGAKVRYHIPNRDKESHGIKLEYLQEFISSPVGETEPASPGKIDVLLTCDTGITSHAASDWCNQNGVCLIITDHHTLADTLPAAYAVINPHLLPENHPLQYLCGVGVGYQVALKLSILAQQPALAENYLDLVAIGTIADVAELRADNRWLVQKGLRTLRQNNREAIRAILKLSETNPEQLSEEHISFLLAPRMNAIGRLKDANLMVPFLLTTDANLAILTAQQLEGINDQRKALSKDVLEGCLAQISANPELTKEMVLVLNHPEWHPGVNGIVASRLVELFHKPTILITAKEGTIGRGSARSIESVNIIQAIDQCKNFLAGYGGHPMAAGISIPYEEITGFRRALNGAVRQQIGKTPPPPEIQIDTQITLNEINLDLIDQLERLAPFGNGNPSLVFASSDLSLVSTNRIGKQDEHLQVVLEDPAGITQRVLWWNGADIPLPDGKFDLAYTLRASNFRGSRQAQVEWLAARTREDVHPATSGTAIKVLDYRYALNPLDTLEQLKHAYPEEIVLWREGSAIKEISGVTRSQLHPAPTLVIWSIPPGSPDLRAALEIVQPKTIILFGIQSGIDNMKILLGDLAGRLQYALRHNSGVVKTNELAEAVGQQEIVVCKGIDWWVYNGSLSIQSREGNQIRLVKGGTSAPDKKHQAEDDLSALLEETAAFRKFYLRVDQEEWSRPIPPKPVRRK